MLLRNVTNKKTPALEARGFVDLQLEVAGELLAPGATKEVSDPVELTKLAHLIEAGALVEEKPKEKMESAPSAPSVPAGEDKKPKKEK